MASNRVPPPLDKAALSGRDSLVATHQDASSQVTPEMLGLTVEDFPSVPLVDSSQYVHPFILINTLRLRRKESCKEAAVQANSTMQKMTADSQQHRYLEKCAPGSAPRDTTPLKTPMQKKIEETPGTQTGERGSSLQERTKAATTGVPPLVSAKERVQLQETDKNTDDELKEGKIQTSVLDWADSSTMASLHPVIDSIALSSPLSASLATQGPDAIQRTSRG